MENLTTFKGFTGMDNIHDDEELPYAVLRRAINTDILDSGVLRRRKGFTQELAITGAHSMWGNGQQSYFIQNNQLCQFLPDGTYTVIGAFSAGSNRAAYKDVAGSIFITCKTARIKLTDGVMSPWGVEVPSSAPVLSATVGTMAPGTYYAAVTYLLADGRESGQSSLSSITLTVAGGIATTAMPNPVDPAITAKRLYLTTTDGEVMYNAVQMAATDQFTSVGAYPTGGRLRTEYKSPPPFGRHITHYNGRIFIVDAIDPSILWFTDAFDYDHVDLTKNYYQFPAPITMVATADNGVFLARNGLYVASDRTYYLPAAGETNEEMRVVSDLTAIEYTLDSISDTSNPIWMTPMGPCIGKHSGVMEFLAEESISVGNMAEAASLIRKHNGLRQYLVVGSSNQDALMQSSSYAEAEVIRRAT